MMLWDDYYQDQDQDQDQGPHFNFDFISLVSKPKDYYKILEVNYDASHDTIRSNYIRLALKCHPDKQKNQDSATSIFQDINEAYQGFLATPFGSNFCANCVEETYEFHASRCICVIFICIFTCQIDEKQLGKKEVLSDPLRRRAYDEKGVFYVHDYNIIDYLNRNKGLILTCNGLGIRHSIW